MALELTPRLLNGSKQKVWSQEEVGKGGIVQIIPTLPFIECSLLCLHAVAETVTFHELSRAVDILKPSLTLGLVFTLPSKPQANELEQRICIPKPLKQAEVPQRAPESQLVSCGLCQRAEEYRPLGTISIAKLE